MNRLEIPATLPSWQRAEIERLRAQFVTDTREVDGVLRWTSNDAVISPSTFADAYVVCSDVQAAGYSAYLDAFVQQYRANSRAPSDEERYEMRAAFGPGVTVVNVVTGRRTRT